MTLFHAFVTLENAIWRDCNLRHGREESMPKRDQALRGKTFNLTHLLDQTDHGANSNFTGAFWKITHRGRTYKEKSPSGG